MAGASGYFEPTDERDGLGGEIALAIEEEEDELEGLRKGANVLARIEIADAVQKVLALDGRNLREIGKDTGIQAADLSRLARGLKGATVASLAQIALGLGKTLKISIE